MTGDLTGRERTILDLETRHWQRGAVKADAIRDSLGLGETRYYQALNALLERPAALAHAPSTVHRLRRLRDARQARRLDRRRSNPGG
ncbi:MAG: DUF3263 domain-containing protein [Salana multivorans]|uniref:DUF3263 domain-containing protein n=1 Tax=Salana multivorans TaxID=120377 RepID=UPI000958E942|nr:DUF3263 domain-containing protein [Salana multivorans]MBN8883339.1 DUF3263 domain-containing protein [Salana multivorans]OJX98425.1 MAG: hypothetical protein BGO96_04495 [Micrococcales bacterium 73-15]